MFNCNRRTIERICKKNGIIKTHKVKKLNPEQVGAIKNDIRIYSVLSKEFSVCDFQN